ncbi:IS481 family transposase, partial [Candidatus Woesearchaeota archaeon]|nr:IS481 family transposase [Candidatus Woesearchaeota archaeon]
MHGKPREILTDNGSEFGGTGKGKNQFDKWCKRRGIEH